MDKKKILIRFERTAPTNGQNQWLDLSRHQHTKLALWIEEFCPDSVEKEQALLRLDECLYWANGSILREKKKYEKPDSTF